MSRTCEREREMIKKMKKKCQSGERGIGREKDDVKEKEELKIGNI